MWLGKDGKALDMRRLAQRGNTSTLHGVLVGARLSIWRDVSKPLASLFSDRVTPACYICYNTGERLD